MLVAGMLLPIVLLSCISPVISTNVPSSVIDLNDRFLEVRGQGHWFVEFFAPWCAHCKRLQPVWEHVAHALADSSSQIRVAKLDCTRFTSVCNALKIHSYPTLIFFRDGGAEMHYEGERTKEEMVSFAVRSSAPTIQPLQNNIQFNEVRSKSSRDPAFVLIGGTADLHSAYLAAAKQLFSKISFYEISNPAFLPDVDRDEGLFVFKDDEKLKYFEDETEDAVTEWIRQERWAKFPKLSGATVHEFQGTARLLVLVSVDGISRKNASTATGRAWSVFVGAVDAAHRDPNLRSRFQWGWLDGTEIASTVLLKDVDVPHLFVYNATTGQHYEMGDATERATRESVLLWLREIGVGMHEAQGGQGLVQSVRRFIYETKTTVVRMFAAQPLLAACLFGVPLAFLSIITYSICSADFTVDREDIYAEEDDDEEEALTDEQASDTDHEKAE